MAFKRKRTYRDFELTSLIDIVFLLLIFFLVSFAFSLSGDMTESQTYTEMELPRTQTQIAAIDEDILENLMIQIVSDTSGGQETKAAFVLWPSFEPNRPISRAQALARARQDSTFRRYPPDFASLPRPEFLDLAANRLIREAIQKYVELERFYGRHPHPIVEVRADKSTAFRIISYIMNECGGYDEVIPQIIIRTAT